MNETKSMKKFRVKMPLQVEVTVEVEAYDDEAASLLACELQPKMESHVLPAGHEVVVYAKKCDVVTARLVEPVWLNVVETIESGDGRLVMSVEEISRTA